MNVKKLREQRGLSQQTVAGQLSLSRTTYTKYENGVHDPSLATLVDAAKFFGVPVDYIAGGSFCSCPDLAARLKSCREEAGMTPQDAASMLDISLELYQDFEDAQAEPTLDMLRKLAQAFHTTADSLLGLAEPEEPVVIRPVLHRPDPGRTARQAGIYERIRGVFINSGGSEEEKETGEGTEEEKGSEAPEQEAAEDGKTEKASEQAAEPEDEAEKPPGKAKKARKEKKAEKEAGKGGQK